MKTVSRSTVSFARSATVEGVKVASAAVATVLLGASSVASAQPASAQAEALFRQGREQLTSGNIAKACTTFESSEKLDPQPTTLLSVGVCREKNGQLATAWGVYVELQRQLRGRSDDTAVQLSQVAAGNAAKLEPKLSKLSISVPDADRVPGLVVTRDGEAIDEGEWGDALPIDGGTYHITARAPGHADWSMTVTVKPDSDKATVTVPLLPAGAAPAVTTPPPPVAPETTRPPRSRKLPIALGAGAVVLGAVGVVLELSAQSTYDDSKTQPDRGQQLDLWHSANTKRYVAEGAGLAAVGAAGLAIYLYVHGRGESAASMHALLPVAGDHQVGLVWSSAY
jgi:hypothetical protein